MPCVCLTSVMKRSGSNLSASAEVTWFPGYSLAAPNDPLVAAAGSYQPRPQTDKRGLIYNYMRKEKLHYSMHTLII